MSIMAAFYSSTTERELAKKKKKKSAWAIAMMECPRGVTRDGGCKVMGGSASVPFDSFVIALNEQYKLQTWKKKKKNQRQAYSKVQQQN